MRDEIDELKDLIEEGDDNLDSSLSTYICKDCLTNECILKIPTSSSITPMMCIRFMSSLKLAS